MNLHDIGIQLANIQFFVQFLIDIAHVILDPAESGLIAFGLRF